MIKFYKKPTLSGGFGGLIEKKIQATDASKYADYSPKG
jgi:hypothetical protein